MRAPDIAPAKTVDDYLHALPEEVHVALQGIREAIKAAAPMAEEVISYQIPTYKHHGSLVHFAAFKDHCSFFGVSKQMLADFKEELKPFKIANTTIHFSAENPLPAELVTKMVKRRIKENEEWAAQKKAAKAAKAKK